MTVVGTRPDTIKLAPVLFELKSRQNIESVNLIDLNKYEWILANNQNGLRRLINEACEQKGFCPMPAIELDRISSVKNVLMYSEKGITILPPTAVLTELSLGLLK